MSQKSPTPHFVNLPVYLSIPTFTDYRAGIETVFNLENFEAFIADRYEFSAVLIIRQRQFNSRKRQILTEYLNSYGFYSGDNKETYLNFSTGEILSIGRSTIKGSLSKENISIVLNFMTAFGFKLANFLIPKLPSVKHLIDRASCVSDTAFWDVFRIDKNHVEFAPRTVFSKTDVVRLHGNAFVEDIFPQDGLLFFNLQFTGEIERVFDNPFLIEFKTQIAEKLKSLQIKDEIIIFKIYSSPDLHCPVHYFDGDELLSTFQMPDEKAV